MLKTLLNILAGATLPSHHCTTNGCSKHCCTFQNILPLLQFPLVTIKINMRIKMLVSIPLAQANQACQSEHGKLFYFSIAVVVVCVCNSEIRPKANCKQTQKQFYVFPSWKRSFDKLLPTAMRLLEFIQAIIQIHSLLWYKTFLICSFIFFWRGSAVDSMWITFETKL